MIEALGVPLTEVDLVLVHGEPALFNRRLRDGDRVALFPRFATLDAGSLPRLREPLAAPRRFVADAHLGGLARLLRMAGFDTLYDNNYDDDTIEEIAGRDMRLVLTRDRELLKRRGIAHGRFVHTLRPAAQLAEVVDRLGLRKSGAVFAVSALQCAVARRRHGDRAGPVTSIGARTASEIQDVRRVPPGVLEGFALAAHERAAGRPGSDPGYSVGGRTPVELVALNRSQPPLKEESGSDPST